MTTEAPYALIIEDDYDASIIFAEALQTAGFSTDIVRDGLLAREKLEEVKPDFIALDLHLPHVSGATLLREIRSTDRLAQTKVVLLTADPLLAETLQEEADLILLKPISFRQLRDLAARFSSNS